MLCSSSVFGSFSLFLSLSNYASSYDLGSNNKYVHVHRMLRMNSRRMISWWTTMKNKCRERKRNVLSHGDRRRKKKKKRREEVPAPCLHGCILSREPFSLLLRVTKVFFQFLRVVRFRDAAVLMLNCVHEIRPQGFELQLFLN